MGSPIISKATHFWRPILYLGLYSGLLLGLLPGFESISLAAPYTEEASRLRALESDVEAALQQGRSVKLDQELIEERLHQSEQQLERLGREIANLQHQLQIHSKNSSSSMNSSSTGNEALRTWQLQTDRNISNLQSGLQSLTSALSGIAPSAVNSESSSTARSTGSKSQETSKENSSESTSYLVKGGDSLEKIARRHHTSIEALKTLNQLKSNKIQAGQKLKIPPAKE